MTLSTLIRRNLLRRKVRLVLTMLSLAVAFLIFGVMGAMQRNYSADGASAPANRLVVTNKIGFTEPLPLSYVQQVSKAPGVRGVSYRTMAAAYYEQERNLFLLMAVEPVSYLQLYPEYILSDGERTDFLRDQSSMLVGETLAKRFGWRVGSVVTINQRLSLQGDAYITRRLRIAGIFHSNDPAVGTGLALFHFKMFNENRLLDRDTETAVVVQAAPGASDMIAKRIDDLFSNSPYETSTLTEEAFSKALLAQIGDITSITRLVVGAGFFSILLIVGSSMAASVRERRHELAILRLLGFSQAKIAGSLLVEALTIVGLGGAIGLILASSAVSSLRGTDAASFGRMVILPVDMFSAVALMVVISVAVIALPAWRAGRISLSTALVRRQA